MAGTLGVLLHDRFKARGWLSGEEAYDLTVDGRKAFAALGIDLEATRALRRRSPTHAWIGASGVPCRRSAGAAILKVALKGNG